MRRKIIILALLVIATGIIIAYVTISVKRSTSKLIQNRLEYHLNELALQSTNSFNDKQSHGNIVNAYIVHDSFLKSQLHNFYDSNLRDRDSIISLLENHYLSDPIIKESGFSLIRLGLNELNNGIEKKIHRGLMEVGNRMFYVQNFYNQIDSTAILEVTLGIEAETIKASIQSATTLAANSVAFVLNHPTSAINESQFTPNNNFTSRWIREASFDSSAFGTSYFYTEKADLIIESVLKIQSVDMQKAAFVVVRQSDNFISERMKWSNRIILINWLIVLLVMSVLTFIILKHEDLSGRKLELQEALSKVEELNKSKDIFFSIIAHDLKNPFNGIMGLSGYLSDEYNNVEDAERQEIIHDINIASKNAFHLLQNLFEWTRAQANLLRNVPSEIDPATIIDLSMETVTNLAKNKGIVIKTLVQTDRKGFADGNIVSTVLRNLATNAVKFSPRNSIIQIIAKQFNEMMVFAVKDQGVGLASDEIDKLFRIDVNFHKKGTEQEPGSGLGLKLCKTFVERIGGQIWVVSDRGSGSTFYFTLPLLND